MAAVALTRPIAPHRSSSVITSLSSTITLDAIAQPSPPTPTPAPALAPAPAPALAPAASAHLPGTVPNKHIPVCPPGSGTPDEPRSSPTSPAPTSDGLQSSVLFPPDKFARVESGAVVLYKIDPAGVARALDYVARQPLPDPAQVFPWLHGLHPQNHIQQAFFMPRRRGFRKTPSCLRGITVVKADGDLNMSRIKGAIAPQEFMQPSTSGTGTTAEFIDVDPREGFSVRNFQIQAAKAAMTSDIIVYGDDETVVTKLGWDIARAQVRWRREHDTLGVPLPQYNTFTCTAQFSEFEENFPEIVALDSAGNGTGSVLDFFLQERKEMYCMTKASEISHNVWIGPTPYPSSEEERQFDILIECSDLGRLNPAALQAVAEGHEETAEPPFLDFPSSGSIPPPTWCQDEADGILETCRWMYHLAHGSYPAPRQSSAFDEDGDVEMDSETEQAPWTVNVRPRKILIHCADGYTETTMLGIAYFSYSTGRPVPDAWLNLHTTKGRNFFAYPTDVALLTAIAPRLLHESPVCSKMSLSALTGLIKNEPRWLAGLDGSFPSRILDYMYLGNLGHANNPDLLRALGIGQILSVGEMPMWRDGEQEEWGVENVCTIQGVQDNGIDPLTNEFERCLEFIDRGRRNQTATLVHCRVGVSRSATICIAEVMRALDMSFPRAYCFVRARRLNVIIQPHLRFAYELLKWEELLQNKKSRGAGFKRELEWGEIAREVALMNRPYASR